MRKLQCELCGSVDILKTADNLFQCQCCGCKYTLEQARYLVQGTVTIAQPDFVIRAGKLEKYNGESTDVVIPSNVTSIGSNAFAGCTEMKKIAIPYGVTTIEHGAFYNCRSLTNIDIPDSVTSIGSSAFCNCSGLISIIIPNGVTEIGINAFENCDNLQNIEIQADIDIKRVKDDLCHTVVVRKIQENRRQRGVCPYCGGNFNGFIIQKCETCKRKKDY